MRTFATSARAGFTRCELLVVIFSVGLLAVVVVAGFETRSKAQANQSKCVGNQKNIGTAFRVFASENNGWYPLRAPEGRSNAYIVSGGAAAGSQVNSESAAAWQVAQAMWNGLQSPKVLLCPADRERREFSRVWNFGGLGLIDVPEARALPKTSLSHADNRNNALSFAFGVAADESRPLGVLMVDRNVNNVGRGGATDASSVALTNLRVSLSSEIGPGQAVWVKATEMHGLEGNLGYADGSVLRATAEDLRQALENAAKGHPSITNQNEMLFP